MNGFKYCPHCRTKLSARLIEGKKRGVCRRCGWIYYRNPLPAVSALVSDKRGRLLLIKRGVMPHKGKWSLPGGFVELDETIKEALERELREETGIKGKAYRSVGASIHRNRFYGPVLIVGFEVIMKGGTLAPGDDAQDARFFPPDKLPQIPIESHRLLIRDYFRLRKV